MIQLEKHIEILLLENDCVIVPDFGGFMAHHLSSRYEESESFFLPPLRTLGFNPQLRLNDSLLAQSYVETYDISYPEALRRIAAEVEELKQILAEKGLFEFNDLGTISLTADGRYEFTPNEAGILTPSLYGLNSFEMGKLGQSTAQENEDESVAKTIPMHRKDGIFIKYSTIRNVAAACIAALVIALFPKQSGDSQFSVANSQFNTELLKRIMPKDITTGTPEQIATAAESQTTEKQAEKETVKVGPSYTIVLACQVGKKNAADFVERLHQKGFNEARVVENGKDIRVVYGSYPNENEAYNALRPLRQKSSDFAEGWVMKTAE